MVKIQPSDEFCMVKKISIKRVMIVKLETL